MVYLLCSCAFVHVCVLCVTHHYLHTLFLISHFTRFLSSAGNRKMKKQAAAVDESEIEKWKEVRSQGRRERCRWFSLRTHDGNQSPWKQHESADHIITLANTHTYGRCACLDTLTRSTDISCTASKTHSMVCLVDFVNVFNRFFTLEWLNGLLFLVNPLSLNLPWLLPHQLVFLHLPELRLCCVESV